MPSPRARVPSPTPTEGVDINRRTIAATTVAVVAALGLTACSGSSTPGPAPTSSGVTASAGSNSSTPTAPLSTRSSDVSGGVPADLRKFYDQKLVWKQCGASTFSCSTLTVPEDYSDPSGKTLQIAVIKDQLVSHPIGSLIVNPGGPGGSGVTFVREASEAFSTLLQHFSLVSFDPRGVGESDPIRCVSSAFLDHSTNMNPVPTTSPEIAAAVNEARTFANDCYKRNGQYLEHVGTIDAARDMDVLRAAVGDAKLTYYGASYGTYLGAKYAQLFPTHIRAMILDGAVNPAQSTMSSDRQQAIGFETDLHDFLVNCVQSSNCSLGSTVAAATQELHNLVAQVTAHPIPAANGRMLGPGLFFSGLASGFYDASDWPDLRAAISEVQQGNPTLMIEFADELNERNANGTYTNLIESNTAINCVDRPSPKSLSTYEKDARSDAKVAPFFGAAIAWSSLPCAYWRVPPVEQAHPVHAPDASATILVMGTTHDPATPYRQAQELTKQLGKAQLVTLVGDGHTAYIYGNTCIDSAANNYLIDLKLPPKGLRCH